MTPLSQERKYLIVIALVVCIPIMSGFFAAYLLIVILMLIRLEAIYFSNRMDFHWLAFLHLSPSPMKISIQLYLWCSLAHNYMVMHLNE